MNFADRPPSTEWVALFYQGKPFAEVWFKPEGQPLALAIRIPRDSFHLPGIGPRLTVGNLLRGVGVRAEEVDAWGDEDASPSGPNGPGPALGQPLTPPPSEMTYLVLHVRLKPPAPPPAPAGGDEPAIPEATWQFLEARWNAILSIEASVESLRMSVEGLRAEMDTASRRTLQLDVKVNALSADVAMWNKAKGRIHFAVPKLREFVHRATWATGTAERKALAEVFEKHIQPRVPLPQANELLTRFEGLLKDRQTLHSQGMAAYQECKGILTECQGALRTLEANASASASRKKGGLGGSKGKGHRG